MVSHDLLSCWVVEKIDEVIHLVLMLMLLRCVAEGKVPNPPIQ